MNPDLTSDQIFAAAIRDLNRAARLAEILAEILTPAPRRRIDVASIYVAYRDMCAAQNARPFAPEKGMAAVGEICERSGVTVFASGKRIYVQGMTLEASKVSARTQRLD